MIRATILTAASAALAIALLPSPASAQLRLIPQVGLYQPFTELPSPGSGFNDIKRKGSFAFGASIELGQPDNVSFRVNVLHATESEVPVSQVTVGCQSDCARSTLTSATATFVIRPLPNIILVRPYLLAGGGVKRYDYTKQDFQQEGLRSLFSDQNQLTGHLGLGAEVNLGLVRLVGEVADLVSKYDNGQNTSTSSDQLQNDVFMTVGLVIGD
jgi:hypothetical protein